MTRRKAALTAALLTGVLLSAQGNPPAAPLVMLSRDGRRPIPTTLLNNQELIALDDVASLFQATLREDAAAGGVTVTYKGQTIVVSPDQAMASVAGRLISLPAPPVRAGRRWLVPVEFISRALALVYDSRIELRRASRLLLVGDVRVPRVTARIETSGPTTRVVFDITPATAVAVTPDGPRLLIHLEADGIDMGLPVPGSGLLDQIRQGDQSSTLVATLRPGSLAPRVVTLPSDAGTRLTIDIPSAQASQVPPPEAAPAAEPLATPVPRAAVQAIVIDPGHGGEDAGVSGPEGVVEKDLTLQVARRVKALIETRLGIRVLLTREDDRVIGPDERAATANNSKADLFISLHFNGGLTASTNGAEVYYLGLDREVQDALKAAQADSLALPVIGGGTRPVDLVRWDMAQARFVPASTELARILEETLRARVPMGPRSLQAAPMRVLVGVNMPAALIELAYLTNPAQAKDALSETFQASVTQAIYDSVLRFRDYVEGRPGATP